jgi:hypothetical protein
MNEHAKRIAKPRCFLLYALAPDGLPAAEANRVLNEFIADRGLPLALYRPVPRSLHRPARRAGHILRRDGGRTGRASQPNPPGRLARRAPAPGVLLQPGSFRRADRIYLAGLPRRRLGPPPGRSAARLRQRCSRSGDGGGGIGSSASIARERRLKSALRKVRRGLLCPLTNPRPPVILKALELTFMVLMRHLFEDNRSR